MAWRLAMKGRKFLLGMGCGLLCMASVLSAPLQAAATSQSDLSAYRAVFDADYYSRTYPDLAAAFGTDENALFNHFVSYGIQEGRSCSAEFNPQAYRQRYADLQAAFGSNMAAYCRHYTNYGKAEGRDAAADGTVAVADTTAAASQAQTAQQPAAGTSAGTASQQTGSPLQQIGSYTTYYEANVPRASNVELAARRINGVVVQPGGSFSFSQTILPRTSANGYVTAPIFINGGTGMGTGGGVCQVSSTLYAAMLTAGLPATERHPHSRPVTYLPQGMDATIAGNYLDLKFTNIYSQPLLIKASAWNGKLTVSLSLQ